MVVNHNQAVLLESMVRRLMHCDREGLGGLVDADLYERYPLEAAIECITYLFPHKYEDEIAEFFRKWRYADDDASADEYISDLDGLISLIRQR